MRRNIGGIQMKLEKMIIKNYRQFEHAELEFDNDVTIVAGANNSGKTSLITLIKNVLSSEKTIYKETDISAKNIKKWIDKVYPLFEKFFCDEKNVEEIETDLLDKILPESEEEEKLVLETTEIYIQVDYDINTDDIKLFADFIYCYEISRNIFGKNIAENFEKIKKRFKELTDPNIDLKKRYLKELLVKLYINSIKPTCYFCDSSYANKCKMDDAKELKNLFNIKSIMASRPTND